MVKPPVNRSVDRLVPQVCARRGVSLVEILFVVAILALVAVGTITYFQPSIADELENAAQIVLADVERARNLSVANNSKYKLTFLNDGSGYYLQHSGSSASLNTLPSWPYKQRTDSADKQTTLLKKLPGLGDVDLIGVVKVASSGRSRVSELEFTSAGATSTAEATEIWLAAGSGTSRRYLTVSINPTTGLADVGDLAGTAPTVTDTSGGSSGSSGLQVSLDLLGTSVKLETSGGTLDLGLGS
jgi:prepilin-type N-terminal cleavage/methylation domain-containing protein